MTRDHVLTVLIALLAALVILVGITSMIDGRRVGAAQAKISILNSQIDTARVHEKIWRDSAARARGDAAKAHEEAARSHEAANRAEDDFNRKLDADRNRPALVITDTAAVRAELAHKDTVITAGVETIAKKNDEIARKDRELADKNRELAARDNADLEAANRYKKLEQINKEMQALVPSRASKVITAAKWLAAGYAIGRAFK